MVYSFKESELKIRRGNMQFLFYDDFMKQKNVIPFSEAERIYYDLLNTPLIHQAEFQEEWAIFVKLCAEYAHARAIWFTMSIDEKHSFDASRTTMHNKVIHQLQLLKALTNEQGLDSSWYEYFKEDRKRIGDFACYVAYIYGVHAR